MKNLIFACLICLLTCVIGGCARPFVIDNGVQSKVFVPCTDDNLCFRSHYDITWSNWCDSSCRQYPVSYRTNQNEYMSNRVEYIYVPRSQYGY